MAWEKINPVTNDILSGKNIGVIGASSADIGRTGKQYWEFIAEKTGAVILDYADGGSYLTSSVEDYTTEATNQLKRIDDLPTTGIDLIVIQPAVNDDSSGRPLGTWDSTSVTTVYGALHAMCKKLYDKYPLLPFGIVTGQYFGIQDAKTSAVQNAIKEVCGYYGVPVLDLHSEGRTPYSYTAWKTTYAPDGLHLTDAGNEVLARRVQSFCRMLLGY